jgi:hypothetical protein
MPTDDQELIATWIRWLSDLRQDLIQIHHHREMWTAVSHAMIEKAPATPPTPATWLNHYQRLYVDGQTIAVRRVIRSNASWKDNVSLGRVIESMVDNPQVLSLDRHLERWLKRDGPDQLNRARSEYAYWSDGSGNLRVSRLNEDKADLNRVAEGVMTFADRSVAHTAEGRAHHPLTFGELDAAIDQVAKVFQDYAVLVTGTYHFLTPVIQDNWQAAFYRPLFDSSGW